MTVTTNNAEPGQKRARKVETATAGLLAGGRRSATSGQRPRNRSWGLVTLAALLVLFFGLMVAAYGLSVGEKTSVLAVRDAVAKGQVIERDDLISVPVSGVDGAFPVDQVSSVVGKTAAVDLVAKQIVTGDMVTSDLVPGPGYAVVGLALEPSRVPGSGLAAGDVVDVIAVPAADKTSSDKPVQPETIATGAEVLAVGGEATQGGQVLVTIVVKEVEGPLVAAASTQNRIAIIETAAGK